MDHAASAAANPAAVAAAFRRACALDVQVRKPGNVSRASPGHRMQAVDFERSAEAAAGPLCRAGARVGERIEGAVRATQAAVGCNTNLGIVLLAAPLAAAAERGPVGERGWREAIEATLAGLDVADAAAAFRAIALARPGGLGRADAHDVAEAPSVDLRTAMAAAAGRDRIAALYAQGWDPLFDDARAALHAVRGGGDAAVQHLYLTLLARWPDSHIVRKHGLDVAHSVMEQAQRWLARWHDGWRPDADAAWVAWDETLKEAGVNPGTTADLTVATLMLDALVKP